MQSMPSDSQIEILAERLACGPSFNHPALDDDELHAVGLALDDLLATNRNLSRAWEMKRAEVAQLQAANAQLAEQVAKMRLDAAYQRAQESAERLAAEFGHSSDLSETKTHAPCDVCDDFAELDWNNQCAACARGAADPIGPTMLLPSRAL